MFLEFLGIIRIFTGGDTFALILDIVAIAAIVGTVTMHSRNKAALAAAVASGTAWREERDAAVSRAGRELENLKHVEHDLATAVARITVLEQRPNLNQLEGLMEALKSQQKDMIQALTDAMISHEKNALERADRLISAIENLKPT